MLRILIIFVVVCCFGSANSSTKNDTLISVEDTVIKLDNLMPDLQSDVMPTEDYLKVNRHAINQLQIVSNENKLNSVEVDSVNTNRELAILYAEIGNSQKSSEYIKKYIRASSDFSILNDHVFEDIKGSTAYKSVVETYKPSVHPFSVVYAFTGILGVFIFILMQFRKSKDKVADMLLGAFLMFHSFFMLHLALFVSKYYFQFPHSFYVSTPFSFFYGPLLYFYFRRVVENYKLQWKDIFHLLPTIGLILFLIPCYKLSSSEKFLLMFDSAGKSLPSTNFIIAAKLLSLIVYSYATYRFYNRHNKIEFSFRSMFFKNGNWERNMLLIFISYTIAYALYGAVIIRIIDYTPLLYVQALIMVLMVLYISIVSFLRPSFEINTDNLGPKVIPLQPKYEKSSLTDALSVELKDQLVVMLNDEKLFKRSDLSLELVAELLNTSRHNASQVINEHFDMNFYELINFYRITEAKRIFDKDKKRNLNIIDVAYEVGYNNKVTFNKAFKKQVASTPTEYIKTLRMLI